MTNKIKMDITNWIRLVIEVILKSRSKIVIENRFAISVGLELLLEYLEDIAERAIELDDKQLIDIILDLGVLKQEE